MCCIVSQFVADMCCSVLHCIALYCTTYTIPEACVAGCCRVLQRVAECLSETYDAVRCSTLQCTEVCCSTSQYVSIFGMLTRCVTASRTPYLRGVLQCVAVSYSMWHYVSVRYLVQCVAVCCSILQCVVACCSVLQCVACSFDK